MDTFHNILLEHIDSLLKERLDLSGDADIEKEINNLIPKIATVVKKSLIGSANAMLREHRSLCDEFVERNISRWAEAFDLLETLIVICTESGEEFNRS
ncbi:hypothetical protein MNO06_002359, partial [Escherichia coli]|nr:hypothetical protein [Escherichia coli]